MKNIRQVIRGDYVATPVKNAFNNKTSYWLSKRGCTVSIYMFTVEGNGDSDKDFEKRLSQEGFDSYIPMLEERCKRPFNMQIFKEEVNKTKNRANEKCFVSNGEPYSLCKGNGEDKCHDCCVYENYEEYHSPYPF